MSGRPSDSTAPGKQNADGPSTHSAFSSCRWDPAGAAAYGDALTGRLDELWNPDRHQFRDVVEAQEQCILPDESPATTKITCTDVGISPLN